MHDAHHRTSATPVKALLMLAALLAVYSEPGRQWFAPLPPPQPAPRRPGNASHDDFIAAMRQRQDKHPD